MVRKAVKNGINFIDTARAYTDSEEKIGEALKEIDKRVYLATKTKAYEREEAGKDVDRSLRNLGVDKVDVYQLHNISDDETLEKVMREDGALAGLRDAQKEGKIDHIGITGHRDETLLKALKTDEFDTVLFCYNFIENECEQGLIDYAKEHDIGMVAMKPLAGGRLNDAQVAIKYVLNQEGVIPVPGMETEGEVEENISIAKSSWELSSKEEEVMENLKEELGEVFCRRCGYCQPCPQDVPIPKVLRAESFINRMKSETIRDGWVSEAFDKAEDCVECEQCVEKCPYSLPIPDLIKENIKIMDDYLTSLQ